MRTGKRKERKSDWKWQFLGIMKFVSVTGIRYTTKRNYFGNEIEGMEDAKKEKERKDLENLATFAEESFNMDSAVKNLRFQLRSVMQSLWWFGSIRRRHINRMEKIKAMITNWSFFLMAGIAVIGIGQVWMIRRLFQEKPATSRMKTRL